VKTPLRFLFDECIGKPVMEALRARLQTDVEFVHLIDLFRAGEGDDVWLPRVAGEGGWIVITADGAKQSGKGPKLPELCRANEVTHVLLSTKFHTKTADEKVEGLVSLWEQLLAVGNAQPGTRYHIRFRSRKGTTDGVRVVLEEVPGPPPLTPPSDVSPSTSE
jgi:hypothetical protein